MESEFRLPVAESVSVVAENILMVRIQEGKVTGGVQLPYVPEDGETLEQDRDIPALVYIVKNGRRIGVKVEDNQLGCKRFPFEHIEGEKLDTQLADSAESWLVNGNHPKQIWRKTKADNIADPSQGYTFLHCIYLVMENQLTPGLPVRIEIKTGLVENAELVFTFDDHKLMSEAIHVNQQGYRSDDPSKKAYLSQWMGLGGGINYDDVKCFHIINENGKSVFTGSVKLNHDGSVVPMGKGELSSFCPVYEMDFSSFKGQGIFRVMVEQLGVSFPFVLGEKVWDDNFRKSMNALFCQRSGIKTGSPYTEFERPRCYHPDEGKIVHQSRCSLFESGNGLNCYGTDTNNFGNLVRKATDEVVSDAWGGYFDACDWDRRIQHLKASKLHIELFLMCPEYFEKLQLPVPESGNGIPDILNEALWNLAFYKRLQMPDGGIRGGIEQEEHPILGQCGWQDTWKAYAYAPDFWCSYYYASCAARMAFALEQYDHDLSDKYRKSAVLAFDYAEKTYADAAKKEGHMWRKSAHEGVKTQRQDAACDLFRLTKDEKYNNIYISSRSNGNFEADFVYCTLPDSQGNPEIKNQCRMEIIQAADNACQNATVLPYHLASENIEKENCNGFSAFCTVPRVEELIRAHFLTGEEKYLAAAIAAEDFSLGANPENLCFTTGMGSRCPKNILHHDSRMTGQNPPVGITIFGPHDFNHPDDAIPKFLRDDILWPGAYVWPSFEAYLDIYRHPCEDEYTVQGEIGPTGYIWGYFAARNKIQ